MALIVVIETIVCQINQLSKASLMTILGQNFNKEDTDKEEEEEEE